MKMLYFLIYFISVLIRSCSPGGTKALAAENITLRKQLITLSRKYKRSPKLSVFDRISFGFLAGFINPSRLSKVAIIVKPSTLLKFHKALCKRKYSLLFASRLKKKPDPKGPSKEVINLILEMKRRNPGYGYQRIAMQINNAFGLTLSKHLVRRVLLKYFKPSSDGGPSWLTFIGHITDSLWSIDLFRCESLLLKSHWVMVIIDQYTRRIINFAVHPGAPDGIALCCMFNKIISCKSLPKYLSSDNDPLFTFHRWQANLRVLDIKEIKTLPFVPISHPFVERLIGSVRREMLDQTLFWNAHDLEHKLNQYKAYYNNYRSHMSLQEKTPAQKSENILTKVIDINDYRWKRHANSLFSTPIAA